LPRNLQVSKLIQEGKLKPTIAQVFPLSEAAAAHELLESGHVRGKVVLEVADLSQ
jgi:NADPH2:quinone reductase